MGWIELGWWLGWVGVWVGFDWIGLVFGLGWCLGWVALGWVGLVVGLGWCLGWVGVWVGLVFGLGWCLGWVGGWWLGWDGLVVGLGWVGLTQPTRPIRPNRWNASHEHSIKLSHLHTQNGHANISDYGCVLQGLYRLRLDTPKESVCDVLLGVCSVQVCKSAETLRAREEFILVTSALEHGVKTPEGVLFGLIEE